MNKIILRYLNNIAEIEPNDGARLSRLVLNGQDVIKYPLKEGDTQKGYPSAILFPFPNRIKDGKYTYQGKVYKLKTNDLQSMNAIHGLVAFEPFEKVDLHENEVTLKYIYAGENEGYPFPFILKVNYKLSKDSLSLTATAVNNGHETMPYGFGWHPYFSFDGQKVSNYFLSAPERERFILNDRKLPTGDIEAVEINDFSLENLILDDVHRISDKVTEAETVLTWKTKKLTISHQSSMEKLKYLVLYIPTTRDCVAIEPQTCCTNSFNTEEGLLFLKPGEKSTFKIDVRLEG